MPAYWVARSKINDPVEYKKYTDLVLRGASHQIGQTASSELRCNAPQHEADRARSCRLQPQIELPDQLVVIELVGRAALEGDLAVHDDVATVGDAQCLRKVLLRH